MSLRSMLGSRSEEEEFEKIKQNFIKQGMSEAEAQTKAELELYSKKSIDLPDTDIIGEVKGINFLVNFTFDNEEEAKEVKDFFGNGKTNTIDGKKLLGFVRKVKEERWK